MNITIDFDKRNLIIVALLILLSFGAYYHFSAIGDKNKKIIEEKNLHTALTDSVHHYKNANGQLVNEKLTIQDEIKDLKDKNLNLTKNQQDLVKVVEAVNKHAQVINAAMIQMGVKLDGLTLTNPVAETDSTEKFTSNPKDTTLTYEIIVSNVKRFNPNILPTLNLKKFELPNVQAIEFHWKNDVKDGNPIAFSVTNSNPYYKVYNIDSYAIPEINKEAIKPTFLQRLGKFGKSTGGKVIIFGAGMIAGGLLLHK